GAAGGEFTSAPAGTAITPWHLGQRIFFPAALSGAFSLELQLSHVTTIGMTRPFSKKGGRRIGSDFTRPSVQRGYPLSIWESQATCPQPRPTARGFAWKSAPAGRPIALTGAAARSANILLSQQSRGSDKGNKLKFPVHPGSRPCLTRARASLSWRSWP